MPPRSISRYEKALCTCQTAFGKKTPIKKKPIFHRTAYSAGMGYRIPMLSRHLPLGPITQRLFIETKPSSGKAIFGMMTSRVGKGAKTPVPHGPPLVLYRRPGKHGMPEEVSGWEGINAPMSHEPPIKKEG
jgi:hypothetical protein